MPPSKLHFYGGLGFGKGVGPDAALEVFSRLHRYVYYILEYDS